VDGQDGGMQAALRVVGLAVVLLVAEDGQDGVGSALCDFAAELEDGLREHAADFVDEAGGLVRAEALADAENWCSRAYRKVATQVLIRLAVLPVPSCCRMRRITASRAALRRRSGFEGLSHLVTLPEHIS
jgi:hypothetical protein